MFARLRFLPDPTQREGSFVADFLRRETVGGAIAKPRQILIVAELPKTRSGKIMRRLLRDVAEGRVLGDTTTLADPAVVEEIKRRAAESPTEE